MASISKRINQDGKETFRVSIRKKGHKMYRTFYSLQDAELFSFYKEKLANNIENFDVPLEQRITIESIFELKQKSAALKEKEDQRLKNVKKRTLEYFKDKVFYHEISFDDWVSFAKYLFTTPVYRGAKTEKGKRDMSVNTLKNLFAYISASITTVQNKGFKIDNHPLKVIRTVINQMKERDD